MVVVTPPLWDPFSRVGEDGLVLLHKHGLGANLPAGADTVLTSNDDAAFAPSDETVSAKGDGRMEAQGLLDDGIQVRQLA